jgi:SAM-dependent methyltransferase
MNHRCRICCNTNGNVSWRCKENMFGWGDEFAYFQCAGCGALQIAEVPEDLGRFYPSDYYSFHAGFLPHGDLKSQLAARRDRAAATGAGTLGRLLALLIPPRDEVASLGRVPATPEMRILDVGCGRGHLLRVLQRAGFRHLAGIDPFLAGDLDIAPGLTVRKRALAEVREQFDLIMLHHVFEHLELPGQALRDCARRLAPGGRILLRFPTADSQAWETYREHWVQLDAPRHLFLHTRRSLQRLAETAGLKVESWACDSGGFQFWASELYRRGIPLASADPNRYFTRAQLKAFDRQAAELNRAGRGDQVAAVLSVKS